MAPRKPIPSQQFDWKNHPVVIAAGSAAATFLFAIALFTQVVLPTQTAKLESDLLRHKDAKEKSEMALKSLAGKVTSFETEIKNLKEDKKTIEQQLEESRAGNIFSPGKPYPNGLASVKIGALRDTIEKNYSILSAKINKEDPEVIVVHLKNSPFERVVFFMSDATPKAKVTHISFDLPRFRSKYSENFLFNKINEEFGQPITDSSGKSYKWTVGSAHSIFAYDKTGFVLMSSGDTPLFWRGR
jgi:hypothetical protein